MHPDKIEAIEWAKDFLISDSLILDTETTALNDAEICQIAMIDRHGNTHMDMLIKPTRLIPADAIAIHGITNEMVAKSPSFIQAWPVIEHLLMRGIVIYNAPYDTGVIRNCLNIAGITSTWLPIASCAMHNYSAYVGERGRYGNTYRWQKLPPCGDDAHNALADCRSTLAIIKQMAGADVRAIAG